MKAVVFALAMTLPVSAAASIAMEPQQTSQLQQMAQSQQATQPRRTGATKHHPLFTVKFVLRRPASDRTPDIIMDDAKPQIAPPLATGHPSAQLGALQYDPNTIVCYGRGCETRTR